MKNLLVGKNYSGNTGRVKGTRKKSDLYETPYSMTKQLLEVEHIFSQWSFLEPAAGNGAIVRVLEESGIDNLTTYDIDKDFLTETEKYDCIITNPPFSIAGDFILKAKQVAKSRFIFLLPLSYLHGKERYDVVWTDSTFPLQSVYVFTRYPMLGDELRADGRYRTGMMVYAWYVWDREHRGPPKIGWLDNQRYILRKEDL